MTTIPRACRLIGHPASQLTPPGAGQHGDLRIPEPSSSLIDGQCGVEEALLLEQQPVVERAVGIAALLGAAVGGLRTGQVTAALPQRAEVARPTSVAALVGSPIRGFRTSQVTAIGEQAS